MTRAPSVIEALPGIWLDARHAVWLESERILAIADLHLGYAWAHRAEGNLLPIGARDDTPARLAALVKDYAPREVALLGDIVHRAVRIEPLREEIRRLCSAIGEDAALRLIAGNHDRDLAPLLSECGASLEIASSLRAGPYLLVHGDAPDNVAADHLREAAARGGIVFLGHEHPAITLSDGVATRAKCPCFLLGENCAVVPAFSRWSAGGCVRSGRRLSAYLRHSPPRRAIAIAAGKLLPLPLPG